MRKLICPRKFVNLKDDGFCGFVIVINDTKVYKGVVVRGNGDGVREGTCRLPPCIESSPLPRQCANPPGPHQAPRNPRHFRQKFRSIRSFSPYSGVFLISENCPFSDDNCVNARIYRKNSLITVSIRRLVHRSSADRPRICVNQPKGSPGITPKSSAGAFFSGCGAKTAND